MAHEFSRWALDCRINMNKLIIISLLFATRTVGITIETLNSAVWQPSHRNIRQSHRTLRPETVSVMRPPSPHKTGMRPYTRIPVATFNKHPVIQRPSSFPAFSPSLFPSYKGDIKTTRSNFAQLHEGYATQNILPGHYGKQTAFNQHILDSTSRKPLQFSDVSDSSILESITNKQVIPFPDKQQSQFQSLGSKERHKQQIFGSSTQNPITLHQNRFVHNQIPSNNNLNQLPPIKENLGIHLHTANTQSSQLTGSKAAPPTEHKQLPAHYRNTSTYQNAEPNVQFAQSIEASEHHSTYRVPSNLLVSGSQPSAIRITKAPTFGKATTSLSENQHTSEIKKKVTLKDILLEDCPNATETGFCASPPRYPSQQISQLMTRCAELLASMYAPVPEDAVDDAWDTTTKFFNSTRNVERGNRQVWSWAHPEDSHQTICESERQRIEPGYVLETPSGRWYVVLQATAMTQRVALEKCRNTGAPCTANKCPRGSGVRNSTAKASRCVQRHSYSHLVTWDPDKPDLCPRIRVFRFPSACVCYLTSS